MTLPLQPIDLDSARRLVDFGVRTAVSEDLARDQLEGAVAVHNMLAREGFAYLADEVGMGKTYVALGVMGLMRHFADRGLRVLYIAPRENIQTKWHKEIRNFTANNWMVTDQKVKTFQQTPAVEPVVCDSLADFVQAVHTNDQRDFVLRLTSLSLALPRDSASWKKKRNEILHLIPWLPKESFSLYNKEEFKEAYARAVNAAMPHFDLLVLDEGHNLKHGFHPGAAARNRALGIVLGHPDDEPNWFRGCDRKVDRVLVLSATPLEEDFEELWHQMNVLGAGNLALDLKNREIEPERRKTLAGRFLVRRLTGLELEGRRHTKNMYRREWRGGGVRVHDQPLELAGDKQRLVVALVQKKVSDVLAAMGSSKGRRFCRSFQIGMLSSFESFLETSKVKKKEESAFDQADQTEDDREKDGVDTSSINTIARSYRMRFKEPLPHPKMDAVGRDVASSMLAGNKTLVFVRRVATVAELVEKVARTYDRWLQRYLLQRLSGDLRGEVRQQIDQYEQARIERRRRLGHWEVEHPDRDEEGDDPEHRAQQFDATEDEGGLDTFFSWFFRGKWKMDVLSGAAFRKNRLDSEGSVFSTMFENNYVKWLLQNPQDPVSAIAGITGEDASRVRQALRDLAHAVFQRRSKQKKFPRQRVFRSYQEAVLRYLVGFQNGDLGNEVRDVLDEVFPGRGPATGVPAPENFPWPDEHLKTATFFNAINERKSLYDALWPMPQGESFRVRFRERERRRELLAASISLGHPFIDLWLLIIQGIGSLNIGDRRQEVADVERLIHDYLDLLERQRGDQGLTSCGELARIAKHFDLISDVNFPHINDKSLFELRGYLGATLGYQTPVGGMSGGVNARMVKQFRMPGYPYVLVTTDVLQEGEDLHTFANRVVHYGISWTPSSMEQRTGRIDRIGSLTHRQLTDCRRAAPEKCLQVYYPHLRDTVEVVQAHEIYRRMNRFVRMLHEQLSSKEKDESSLDLGHHLYRLADDIAPIKDTLTSSFDIDRRLLQGTPRPPSVGPRDTDRVIAKFEEVCRELESCFELEWETDSRRHAQMGTVYVKDDRLVAKGENRAGSRHQPFTMFLRTASGGGHMLLRFASPIGSIEYQDRAGIQAVLDLQRQMNTGKLCAALDAKHRSYVLSSQKDILFAPQTTQIEEVKAALEDAIVFADIVELEVLGEDKQINELRGDLEGEEDAEGR